MALFLAVHFACSGSHATIEPPVPEPPVAPEPPIATVQATTPAELYGACKERVEGQEAAGECSADADCARAGCSQEVCLPASKAGDVMTTCEILPCFSVLSSCGCLEGRCAWTLSATVPELGKRPDVQ